MRRVRNGRNVAMLCADQKFEQRLRRLAQAKDYQQRKQKEAQDVQSRNRQTSND